MLDRVLQVNRRTLSGLLARREDHVWRPSRATSWASVAVVTAVYAVTAWRSRHPVIALDEIVMIGESHAVSGTGEPWQLAGGGFAPGLAILMAPTWWFTDSGAVVFQVGIVIAALAGVLAIWPLARFLTRVGASPGAGVVIASVVMVAPARALLHNYLVAESLFVLAAAGALLAAVRLWERPSWSHAVVLGLAAGAATLVHGRGVALAGAIALWCLTLVHRGRGIFLGAAALSAASALSALGVYAAVAGEVLVSDDRVATSVASAQQAGVVDLVAGALGQLWYAALAWPAVALGGILWATAGCVRNSVARLLVLATCGSVAIGLAQLSPGPDSLRIDVWFYGRYNDHLWTILAAVGLAVLIRARWPLFSLVVAVSTAASGLLMLVVTVPRIPTGLPWVDMHVMGISPWLDLNNFVNDLPQEWVLLTLLSLLLCVIVLALAWMRAVVAPVLLVSWALLSVGHDAVAIDVRDGRPAAQYYSFGLDVLPADASLALADDARIAGNMVVFAASDQSVVRVDLDHVPEDVDVVYAPLAAQQPAAAGARRLDAGPGGLLVAWVYPGDVFDVLDAQGLLLEPSP